MNKKRQQELFLDGIELSMRMAKIAFNRLERVVLEISRQGNFSTDLQDVLFLDAWSYIDSVNRLRLLTKNTPGLKQTSAVKLFLKVANDVEEFRNYVQHLPGEINKLSDTGKPIWGAIGWWFMSPEMHNKKQAKGIICMPGRLAKGKGIGMIRVPQNVRAEVDHIQITAGERLINLTEVQDSISRFSERFLMAVKKAEENTDPTAIIRIELSDSQMT